MKMTHGIVQRGGFDCALARLQVERLADFKNGRARDARQRSTLRRHGANGVVVDPEQIAAGGLGRFAVRVEEQCLVRASFRGFGARHDVQNFARGFERRQRIVGGNPERGGDEIPLQRSAEHRLGVAGNIFAARRAGARRSRHRMQSHHDRRFAFAVRRIAASARPARQRQAQNRVGHLVQFDELTGEFFQFLRRERQFDFQEIRAARQPFQMLRKPKRPPVDDAYRLKQSVAQQKAAVAHGNDRLRFGNKFVR